MKKLYFIFIILFLTQKISAQENFYPGYIITTENDTILGKIEFKDEESNANICNFKKSDSKEIISYKPGEIKGYRFLKTEKYYISYEIKTEKRSRHVFFEYLIQGPVQLYYYRHEWQDYFFIENPEGEITVVMKKPDEKVRDPKTLRIIQKEDNQYKIVLMQTFYNCPLITEDITKMTTLNRSSMIDIVKNYIACINTSEDKVQYIEFGTKDNKLQFKIEFSLYTGIRYQSFNFEEKRKKHLSESMYSIYPQVGTEIGLSMPRVLKPVSIQLGMAYSKMGGADECNSLYEKSFTYYKKYTFNSDLLIGNLGIRYTYPNGKIRPTAEFGGAYTYLFNYSSKIYKEENIENKIIIESSHDLKPSDNTYFCIYGSLGVNFKVRQKSFVFLRFDYDNLFQKTNDLSSMQVKLGYIF